jgi:hypothetical protein
MTVIPWYENDIRLPRILTDRGTEHCSNRKRHESHLYRAIEDIDYPVTKARSPQPNGIYERLRKTIQDGFYAVAFRKKMYRSLDEIQENIDTWIEGHKRGGHVVGSIASARHRTKHYCPAAWRTTRCWTN